MNKLIQFGHDIRSASDIVNIHYEDDVNYTSQGKHIVTFGLKGSFDDENKHYRTYCRRYYFESLDKYVDFLKQFKKFMNSEELIWDASEFIIEKCKTSFFKDTSASDRRSNYTDDN